MGNFDLLSAVQPEGGWYAVVGINDKGKQQELVNNREDFDEWVEHFVRMKRNVFFGVAKYKDDSSRAKTNVEALKAFWVDIDCGPGKAYDSQADGMLALREFCTNVGLPKPIVVNSGRGLHVYWPLDKAINREEWERGAKRLKDVCVTQGLEADPTCFEPARILRVPGTYNFKGDTPLAVEVLTTGKPITYDEFCDILGVPDTVTIPRSGRGLSPLAKMLQANLTSNFAKIMRRGADGCSQLNSCFEERDSLSEPRWFDALSVAKFCEDKAKAIHKLSADHPDYDPATTEQKLRHIAGPHTCAVFEQNNPGGCAGCPHLGKIKSPIVLGRVLVEAEDDEVHVDASTEDEIITASYKIPEYPFPYARGKSGGIYLKGEGDESEPILIYPYDLYVVKRMRDPVEGGVVLIRSHTPKDGIEEFTINNSQITEPAEVRKELAKRDILLVKKKFDFLVDYIIRSAQALREQHKAELMRTQFGWADADKKFIVGNRELTIDGTYHSPPSTATRVLTDHMVPKGTLEKWQEVFNLYGRPGLEGSAFAAATAFGAPLLRFSGQRGAIINLVNTFSGTGKTTILHMCNSVWGDPERLCAKKDDTFNSKVHKIGVMCNLPVTFDEMSNTEPKQLSELAYLITQGMGKDRMKASANELRINNTSWQTIALCSSNHSFYEKLESIKNNPQGEMMRIIEYSIDYNDAIDPEYGKEMFDRQLRENFGHAGDIYARYILENYEDVKAFYLTVQNKFDTVLKLSQRERFWSATAAANMTGIYIAVNKLQLMDWDIAAIFKWTCKMLLGLRGTTEPPVTSDSEVFGDFLLHHMDNILIVNDGVDLRSKMHALPILEPRRELLVRYEPDMQRVFIVPSAFRNYCSARSIGYRETLKKLKAMGLYIGTDKKRMSKGMAMNTTAVHVLVFDAKHSEFSYLNEVAAEAVEKAKKNEGSGDRVPD